MNRPERAVQSHLPQHDKLREHVRLYLPGGCKNAYSHGYIERRAFLANVGRSEVHGDPAEREFETAVPYRRADPFPALPYRTVGQPNDGEAGDPLLQVGLDVDYVSRHTVCGAGKNLGEHEASVRCGRARDGPTGAPLE